MKKSLTPQDVRTTLGLTQAKLAALLDVTSEYVSMIETGKKPVSKKVLKKLESLMVAPSTTSPAVAEDHAPYQAPSGVCRYPAGCDLQTELADLRAEVSSMRSSIDTLLGLLGAPLRRAAGIEDGNSHRPAV